MNPSHRDIAGDVRPGTTIQHDGTLSIQGSIDSGCLVIASGDIVVAGDVNNSRIKSGLGSIAVTGCIRGATTQVQANRDVEARVVFNSFIKANNDIRVEELAIDAHMVARNSITFSKADSSVEGGEIEAGKDIIVGAIGNSKKMPTSVKLSNFKQLEFFEEIMLYDREAADIRRRMDELDRLIAVIRILGKKVVALPAEKKQELALRVKEYNHLRARLSELDKLKENIRQKNSSFEDLERTIIAKKEIFEGVLVTIDKQKLAIQNHYNRVILYKKGIVIVGNYDEFMKRKKYY